VLYLDIIDDGAAEVEDNLQEVEVGGGIIFVTSVEAFSVEKNESSRYKRTIKLITMGQQ
jgi:hypothetical protein